MADNDAPHPKDRWDKLRIFSTSVSVAAIPVILAVIGNSVNVSLKETDVRLRTVELAIGILQEDPSKGPSSETKALRAWAMDVIDNYSGVALPQDARAALQTKPLAGSSGVSYFCLDGQVRLSIPRITSVSISEDREKKRCNINVGGVLSSLRGKTVKCRRFDATIQVPENMIASIFETAEMCHIILN